MAHLLDRVGAGLLDAGLAATALSGLVVLAMVQCRQPARRLVWARTGLVAILAIVPLAALNPLPHLDLWRPLVDIVPATLDEPGPGLRPLEGAEHKSPPCPSPVRVRPGRWGVWPRRVGRVVVVTYLAGVSIGLGGLALGLWGSGRLVRRGATPSPETLAHHGSLPFAGSGRRPVLLICDRASRPVLLGWFRSVILIPPDFDDPDAVDRLRLALLHELAHAEAGDHRFGPIWVLAQSFWYFLPTVWWLRDQSRLDQEFLADRRAVDHFGTSGRYASSLVDLAASPSVSKPVSSEVRPAHLEPAGVASALFQRILMLLKCPFAVENQPPAWWRRSTACAVGLATLIASCLSLQGLAGWPDSPARRTVEPARSFELPQLTITQQGAESEPFDLRVRLPEEFSLTLEIMAEPAELAIIEILGHRLQSVQTSVSPDQPFWLWHRVEIRRSGGIETVRVDGQVIDEGITSRKPSFWLTIRPIPSQPTRIRNLALSW